MLKKQYKKERFYWGIKPEGILKEVVKYTFRGVALDIGGGEGRNAIFLAKNGFSVELIDKIREGVEKCKNYAKKYNLPIKTYVVDVKNFNFKTNKYSLIISITGGIEFLKFSEIKKIFKRIKKALKKEGVFYLTVFSKKDPTFKFCQKSGIKIIEKGTFYFPKEKMHRHYFEKKELIDLFRKMKFKILYMEQKNTNQTQAIHFHNIIRIITKK